MTNIVFEPWIGAAFEASSPRLLLLGESHYGESHKITALETHHVVEQWRSHQRKIRYLLAAARTLTGLEARDVDKRSALERIAFYNYVQSIMPSLKYRPKLRQIQQSEPAFREVLEKLDPTHIVATGYTLWRGMPHFDVEGISGSFQQFGGEKMEVGRYCTPSGYALVTVIPHLSRAFAPQRWHGPVSEFLDMKL